MNDSEDRRPPEDDPFAFAPDERDLRERRGTDAPDAHQARAADGSGVPQGPGKDGSAVREGRGTDAPGPTAGRGVPGRDARATREASDGRGPGTAPGRAEPGGTSAPPPSSAARARAAEDDAARARAAEESAARRALLGAEASRSARAATSRWLLVGVVLLLVLAVGSTILAGRGGDDAQVRPGERLPAFAAPIATRPKLASDYVNLAQRDDQGQAGRRAACSIRSPSAVTSCALLRRGPLVLVIFARGVDGCLRAVDDVERVRRALPGLTALAVATNGTHDETARTARARGWGLVTAYDVDGALASRLGAAVCPLVLFVRRDGSVADRLVGHVDEAAVRERAGRLLEPRPTGTTTGSAAPAGR